jgi:hypothetical protein
MLYDPSTDDVPAPGAGARAPKERTMPDSRPYDPDARAAACPTVAGANPMQLVRIGYGLTLLSSLLAFVMRAA